MLPHETMEQIIGEIHEAVLPVLDKILARFKGQDHVYVVVGITHELVRIAALFANRYKAQEIQFSDLCQEAWKAAAKLTEEIDIVKGGRGN